MTTLQKLKSYAISGIENWGGITSPDYKEFEKTYRKHLRSVAKSVDGELVKFMPQHYEFSCFVKRNNKFVYISISDVRYFRNEWQDNILIRTAQNESDYHGGSNNYATLKNINEKIKALTEQEE